jgi:Protein of unknown function (DUF3485)
MRSSEIPLSRRDLGLCVGGIAVLLAAAGADGVLHQGLSDPKSLSEATRRLDRIPASIGAWTSTARTIDDRELRLAEIDGFVRRDYRHSETGQTVSLTILCGAAGPMSVHPPTACFEGVGYSLVSGPTVAGITDDSGHTVSLKKASFRLEESAVSEVIRVFWGWSTDGEWDAPSSARMSYRGQPWLYKLYAVDRAYETGDNPAQSEAFFREALPAIRTALNRSR